MLTSLSQTNYQPIFDNEQSYNHKIGRDLERACGSQYHTSLGCIELSGESNSLPSPLTFLNKGSSLWSPVTHSSNDAIASFINFLLFLVLFLHLIDIFLDHLLNKILTFQFSFQGLHQGNSFNMPSLWSLMKEELINSIRKPLDCLS